MSLEVSGIMLNAYFHYSKSKSDALVRLGVVLSNFSDLQCKKYYDNNKKVPENWNMKQTSI